MVAKYPKGLKIYSKYYNPSTYLKYWTIYGHGYIFKIQDHKVTKFWQYKNFELVRLEKNVPPSLIVRIMYITN